MLKINKWLYQRRDIIWSLGLCLLSEGECDTMGFKQFMLRWWTELNWQLHYSLMAVPWFSNVCSDGLWHAVQNEMMRRSWRSKSRSRIYQWETKAGEQRCVMAGLWSRRQLAATSCQVLGTSFGYSKRQVRHWICQRSICHFQLEILYWRDLYSNCQITGNREAVHKCIDITFYLICCVALCVINSFIVHL